MSQLLPKISVIIPNYNHCVYLPQRIESVLSQTYQNIEVILMDDCSTDDSHTIIADYASRDSRVRVVLNQRNSGSTFKQWNKGIGLAEGKYVWIAESDDYADYNLLADLVNVMETNSAIGLAYCDSITVDENGLVLNEMKHILKENLKTNKWDNDFVMDGKLFIKKHMSFSNSIPNASAVLLRKGILNKVGPAGTSMKLAGDWMYWINILAVSDVAYLQRPQNYFRTHTNNVRSKTLKDGTFLEETSKVMAYIKSLIPNEPYEKSSVVAFLDYWVYSYKIGYVPLKKNFVIAKNINRVLGGGISLLKKLINYIYNGKIRNALQ